MSFAPGDIVRDASANSALRVVVKVVESKRSPSGYMVLLQKLTPPFWGEGAWRGSGWLTRATYEGMCFCGKDKAVVCCGAACCGKPESCPWCRARAVTKPRIDPPRRTFIISKAKLHLLRGALYDAKLAIEQGFQGREKDAVMATIAKALDETRDLPDAISGS